MSSRKPFNPSIFAGKLVINCEKHLAATNLRVPPLPRRPGALELGEVLAIYGDNGCDFGHGSSSVAADSPRGPQQDPLGECGDVPAVSYFGGLANKLPIGVRPASDLAGGGLFFACFWRSADFSYRLHAVSLVQRLLSVNPKIIACRVFSVLTEITKPIYLVHGKRQPRAAQKGDGTMTTNDFISQANLDAQGLREECSLEGRPFSLRATDDWDATAFAELGLTGQEAGRLWPVYQDALREAIRAIGGIA